jgi:Tfp pilus assembly protein PilF
MADVAALRKLVGGPRDGALLRFSLARALLDGCDVPAALVELRQAVRFDPAFSAAFKLLGQTLAAVDRLDDARNAFRDGIAAAQARGDVQAAKEMTVFLRRLERA